MRIRSKAPRPNIERKVDPGEVGNNDTLQAMSGVKPRPWLRADSFLLLGRSDEPFKLVLADIDGTL
jgi:hypothetical protein